MDKLARLRIYSGQYLADATQHRSYRVAREWMEMDVPANEAADWANLGYLPAEAAPLIADGITPAMAAAGDEAETAVAGGSAAHAMQRIRDLIDDGILVDPARVRQEQDPDDPTHIIVYID